MKISVAMATYNGSRFIKEQVLSLQNQTIKPDELVVCDDCSTDNTVELLKELSHECSFNIKVIQNEHNLGYAQNFSKTLGLTSGDIVFLSDQDDVWLENKIEICLNEFKDSECQFVIHDAIVVNENLVKLGLLKYNWNPNNILSNISGKGFSGNCCAMRVCHISRCLPIPENYPHDQWLGRIAFDFGSVRVIKEPLLLYRRHEKAVSSTPHRLVIYNIIKHKLSDLLLNINPVYEKLESEKTYLNFLNNLLCCNIVDDTLCYKIKEIILNLEKKIWFLEERIRILQYPLCRRYLYIIKNFLLGRYSVLENSWKRCLEDFLSPRNKN